MDWKQKVKGGLRKIDKWTMTQENKQQRAGSFSRFLSGISRRRFLRLSTGSMAGGFVGCLLNREKRAAGPDRTPPRGENRARLRELSIDTG